MEPNEKRKALADFGACGLVVGLFVVAAAAGAGLEHIGAPGAGWVTIGIIVAGLLFLLWPRRKKG